MTSGRQPRNTFEAQVDRLVETFVDGKIAEAHARAALGKLAVAKDIALELNFVMVPRGEYDSLKETASKSAADVEAEVKARVQKEGDRLQRELEHQVELVHLKHVNELTQARERLRLLEPYAPRPPSLEPASEPAAAAAPAPSAAPKPSATQ